MEWYIAIYQCLLETLIYAIEKLNAEDNMKQKQKA